MQTRRLLGTCRLAVVAVVAVFGGFLILSACAAGTSTPTATGTETATATATSAPQEQEVGLEINIADGNAQPLTVIADRDYFIDRLFITAKTTSTTDNGLDDISKNSELRFLDWSGTAQDQEMPWRSIWPYPVDPAATNLTGQEFYRGSAWVKDNHKFTVQVLDSSGSPVGDSIELNSGRSDQRSPSDSWSIRRFATIRYIGGAKLVDPNCSTQTESDCDIQATGPFTTEARLEMRNSTDVSKMIHVPAGASAIRINWDKRGEPYTVPIKTIDNPTWDYGLKLDMQIQNEKSVYQPGDTITVTYKFMDKNGKDLFPDGLPTVKEFTDYFTAYRGGNPPLTGKAASGVTWFHGDPTIVYYWDKSREATQLRGITGPKQDFRESYFEWNLQSNLANDPAKGGNYLSLVDMIPPIPTLFGGAATENDPVPDTYSYTLPADAKPGTYLLGIKVRRDYLGQGDLLGIDKEVQVGTPERTAMPGDRIGNCEQCHVDSLAFNWINHRTVDREMCYLCHMPITPEPDNSLVMRVHTIHYRSDRVGIEKSSCVPCHVSNASTERVSRIACAGCHGVGLIMPEHRGVPADLYADCAGSCHQDLPDDHILPDQPAGGDD